MWKSKQNESSLMDQHHFIRNKQHGIFLILDLTKNLTRINETKDVLRDFVLNFESDDRYFLYIPTGDIFLCKTRGEMISMIDNYNQETFNLSLAIKETFYITTYVDSDTDKKFFVITDKSKDNTYTITKFKKLNELQYKCDFSVLGVYNKKASCDLFFPDASSLREYLWTKISK